LAGTKGLGGHKGALRPIRHRNHGYGIFFSKVEEKYNTRFQNPFSESGLFYVSKSGLSLWIFITMPPLQHRPSGIWKDPPYRLFLFKPDEKTGTDFQKLLPDARWCEEWARSG
jgi:hypothetical protein